MYQNQGSMRVTLSGTSSTRSAMRLFITWHLNGVMKSSSLVRVNHRKDSNA